MELDQNEVNEVQDTTSSGETSEETNLDGFLEAFDETEEVEEEAEETEDTEGSEDEEAEAEATPQAEEPKHKIRVDHKDVELTLEELKAHAQKGMAFDRLKSDYDQTRAQTERLKALAQKQNISIEDLITQAEVGYMESLLSKMTEDYVKQGYDEDVAETLALKDLEISGGQSKDSYDAEEEKRAQLDNEAAQFMTMYPNVNPDDIPDSVFDDINNHGISLLEAYQRYEISQLRQQAEAVKQNNANKKSLGSAKDGKRTVKEDDFLTEFMKE